MHKYEYLTGEDIGLKPSDVEQAKFKYSPLGKIFNKELSLDDKKEGLLKRLENVEDKMKSCCLKQQKIKPKTSDKSLILSKNL